MFYAERNKGAFLNGMKIQISNKKDIKDASLIVSRSEYGNNLWNNYFEHQQLPMKKRIEVKMES